MGGHMQPQRASGGGDIHHPHPPGGIHPPARALKILARISAGMSRGSGKERPLALSVRLGVAPQRSSIA